MFYTSPSKAIRRDYSISTDCMDRRLTLRLDPDTTKCLELTYAQTIASGLYPFKDKSSFLRWCVHEKYREIVRDRKTTKTDPPVYFGSPHATECPPQISIIQPPDNLEKLIGSDERSVYEPLWSAHLVQSLTHWLMHAHPNPISEANALRNLETFFGGSPLIFRKAAARLYILTATPYNF